MDKQHILKHFASLAGLSAQEALCWAEAADITAASVRNRLRPEIDVDKNAFLLEYYCAALLYSRFALQKEAEEPATVKAEGFSVSRTSGRIQRAAAALEMEALDLVKSLLQDNGYFFESVR